MRKILLASLLLIGAGCSGVSTKGSCTRNLDGSITCSIEAHKAGEHAGH